MEAFSPDAVTEASKNRLEQAADTGAEYIVSACQQCMRTFFSGARKNKIRVRAIDLTQLVLESIENGMAEEKVMPEINQEASGL